MNRRSFLQRAALAVAGLAIDPERLIWTPGERTYFDLGPLRYRVMLGDWLPIQGAALYTRAVLTVHNQVHHGVTMLAREHEWADPRWPAIEAERQAKAEFVLAARVKDYDRTLRRMR